MDACVSKLVDQAKKGSQDALVELLRLHGPAGRRVITGKIPWRWRAALSEDDVVQQTYADATFRIGQFRGRSDGAFIEWLRKIAQRNLQDALKMLEADKRGGNRPRVDGSASPDSSYVQLIELVSSPGRTPSSQAARVEAVKMLKAALAHLPEDYKRTITLYDLQGLPVQEVAASLHRSPGAVFMLRARALQRLRDMMGRASDYLSSSS